MIPQLLEPTANSPVSDTDANRDTQRYDGPAPAKRQRQGHSNKRHYQDAERADVFALDGQAPAPTRQRRAA